MEHAGMTHLLADGMVHMAGSAFPLVAPFIGALGAFMTGSNTPPMLHRRRVPALRRLATLLREVPQH
jgi:hypothetical protein